MMRCLSYCITQIVLSSNEQDCYSKVNCGRGSGIRYFFICDINMLMQSCTHWLQCWCLSGPACSETVESVAGVSKHFNMIVISYSSEIHRVHNRDQFPLFLSTVPHFLQYR